MFKALSLAFKCSEIKITLEFEGQIQTARSHIRLCFKRRLLRIVKAITQGSLLFARGRTARPAIIFSCVPEPRELMIVNNALYVHYTAELLSHTRTNIIHLSKTTEETQRTVVEEKREKSHQQLGLLSLSRVVNGKAKNSRAERGEILPKTNFLAG